MSSSENYYKIITLEEVSIQQETLRKQLKVADGLRSIIVKDILSPAECEELVERTYQLQSHWRAGTSPGEFTFGRSFYTSFDNRDVMDYFDEAPGLNAVLQTNFPWLMPKIFNFCHQFTQNTEVTIREGWAGPAIVIFHAGGTTSKEGGSVHIDFEGASRRLLDQPGGLEKYSFMLPLQLPQKGGNLRTWPEVYKQYHHDRYLCEITSPQGECKIVAYSVGSIIGLYSLRIHEIEPFESTIDRVILTFHLAQINGAWKLWF